MKSAASRTPVSSSLSTSAPSSSSSAHVKLSIDYCVNVFEERIELTDDMNHSCDMLQDLLENTQGVPVTEARRVKAHQQLEAVRTLLEDTYSHIERHGQIQPGLAIEKLSAAAARVACLAAHVATVIPPPVAAPAATLGPDQAWEKEIEREQQPQREKERQQEQPQEPVARNIWTLKVRCPGPLLLTFKMHPTSTFQRMFDHISKLDNVPRPFRMSFQGVDFHAISQPQSLGMTDGSEIQLDPVVAIAVD
eukprot:TRINITY_DN2125_c0_g2_i1.p1 TRINITY_DN2125_c0_g2~~TRINITY_DN2125_c0_g2_i1.p1  ORF type:complete len:250 (+),score=59.79 TRINITY_DN2125_c0_g2_i1:867-1616(+)